MTCHEAEPYVSVLYDGEPVPPECADHIAACDSCRQTLRRYSEIGAELRLIASRAPQSAGVPPALASRLRPSKLAFLNARILVPRFAMALLVLALATASTGFMILRAQSPKHQLWFQFELSQPDQPLPDGQFRANLVAQAGYDDGIIAFGLANQIIGTHVTVFAIKEGSVEIALQSRRYSPADPSKFKVKQQLTRQQRFQYTPGQTLTIPVEGGGTLQLRGAVTDHQPKLAWGLPVEPSPDQIVLTSPIVISGDKVLANFDGGSAQVDTRNLAAYVSMPTLGRLTIALQPFSGSIPAQANWGNLKFDANGQQYTLFSASPITGGEQPHAVWVALEPQPVGTPGAIGARHP